jgi:hypothetical protein
MVNNSELAQLFANTRPRGPGEGHQLADIDDGEIHHEGMEF